MAKLDIFDPQWLDVVFKGRNQAYGAYVLRKENPKTITKALIIGSVIFILLVTSPLIAKYISGFTKSSADDEKPVLATEVVLQPPPPVDEQAPPPPPAAEPPRPKVDQVKFPPPVVVPAEQVKDEEPPTVEELKVADPGQKTIAGDPTAEIRIDEPVGEAPQGAAVTEDNSVYNFASIEQLPEFPGGQAGWRKFLERNLRYPAMARENNIQGRVTVQFVVEKDGSLTDIKVLRGIGAGCDEEAVRVLKSAPKWKPGVQNGRPVRVSYVMPIVFQLAEQ